MAGPKRPPRPKLTAKRKAEITAAAGAEEPFCVDCGDTEGPFQADHEIPRGLNGSDEIKNMKWRCVPCHLRKTTERDVPAIAKAKRIERKDTGQRKPSTIRSRGFTPGYRPIPSRPFPKRPR